MSFVANMYDHDGVSDTAQQRDAMERLNAEAESLSSQLDNQAEAPVELELQAETTTEVASQEQVDAELKNALETNEDEPSFVERRAGRTRRKFFRRIFRAARSLFSAGRRVVQKLTGSNQKFDGQKFEDCLACRFVWKQVEMDVGNARYIEDVQASFEHNCMDAQKSTIFYKACEDMYDDMYALADDYMSGAYSVDTMCQRAKLCVSPK